MTGWPVPLAWMDAAFRRAAAAFLRQQSLRLMPSSADFFGHTTADWLLFMSVPFYGALLLIALLVDQLRPRRVDAASKPHSGRPLPLAEVRV